MKTYIIFIDEKQNKKNLGVLEAYQLIRSSGGKIMRVTFTKRTTGEERTMVCRTGVTKGVKGTGNSNKVKDLLKNHIVKVWDIQKNAFRSINLDTVKEIRMEGHTITSEGVTETKQKKKKIVGYQVVNKLTKNISMTLNSWEVFSRKSEAEDFKKSFMFNSNDWEVVTVYEGDIEGMSYVRYGLYR